MRHWQVRTFAVTWLAYVGLYLTRKSFSVAKVELRKPEVLGLSTETLSWIDGGYSIAYACGQFAWGVLGDRFGTRAVVLVGMAASVVVACATGSAGTALVIGGFMALQGVCQSSGWAPLTKNMGEFFPRSVRGRVMGLWCSNFALGSFVGAWVAGAGVLVGGALIWLPGWLGGPASLPPAWRMTFFLPAAGLAVIAMVFALLQANRPEDVGLPSAESEAGEAEAVIVAGEAATEEPEGSWHTIREVLASRIVLLIAGVYLLVKPLRYLLMFWAPVYISERLGTGAAESGVIGSLFDLAGPLGIFAGGWVSDRIFGARRFPVMAVTLAAAGIALAALPLVPANRLSLGAMLFLVGMLVYIPDSLASGAAAIDFGTRRGASTAVGIINGCGSLGQTLGVMLPGLVKQATDSETTPWNPIFLGLAGGLVFAALLVAPQWNRLPATARPG
jgi:OPA family glycerol-3-phosphate transporter-like MFS transporter